ncbi:hypothetical protein J7M00_00025 [bacterium]|nr:hypothetical protein [bacterium]
MLKLGEILVREGFCTREDVEQALQMQDEGDSRRLGEILLDLKKITLEQLERALAIQWTTGRDVGISR